MDDDSNLYSILPGSAYVSSDPFASSDCIKVISANCDFLTIIITPSLKENVPESVIQITPSTFLRYISSRKYIPLSPSIVIET